MTLLRMWAPEACIEYGHWGQGWMCTQPYPLLALLFKSSHLEKLADPMFIAVAFGSIIGIIIDFTHQQKSKIRPLSLKLRELIKVTLF